jgi:hypothetical protein
MQKEKICDPYASKGHNMYTMSDQHTYIYGDQL